MPSRVWGKVWRGFIKDGEAKRKLNTCICHMGRMGYGWSSKMLGPVQNKQYRCLDPLDQFVSSEARQITTKSRLKNKHKEVVIMKILRCFPATYQSSWWSIGRRWWLRLGNLEWDSNHSRSMNRGLRSSIQRSRELINLTQIMWRHGIYGCILMSHSWTYQDYRG